MNEELLDNKDFGKFISKAEKSGSKNYEIQNTISLPEEERFNAVIEYVKNNFNWNGHNDKYASKSPSDLEKTKTGNSADINLYAIGLLKSIGLNVYPVAISTRNNGKIKSDYPFLSFFNYVIILAEVNGKKVISDATEVMNLNNRVPVRCINNKGIIVQKDKVEWISLETSVISSDNTNIIFSINEDNLIKGNITKNVTEYTALQYKNAFGENKNRLKDYIKSQIYEVADSSIKIADFKKRNKNFAFSFDMSSRPEIINGKMYIDPFFGRVPSENPLKQLQRNYPIDMTYPERNTLTSTFTIPKGWDIDFLPANQKENNDLFEFEYQAVRNENDIKIVFSYSFKKSVYPPTHYLLIKSYFNDIIQKGNEKIVLIKR